MKIIPPLCPQCLHSRLKLCSPDVNVQCVFFRDASTHIAHFQILNLIKKIKNPVQTLGDLFHFIVKPLASLPQDLCVSARKLAGGVR